MTPDTKHRPDRDRRRGGLDPLDGAERPAATLAAMGATTAGAALAQAAGIVFQVPDGGETTPFPGSRW